MPKRFDEPAKVRIEGDEVVVNCPDGETSTWTPEAALKTAQRLSDMAVEAIVDRGRSADTTPKNERDA